VTIRLLAEYKDHTDNELFTLIAEGNEGAFEALFNIYVPKISSIIYRIIKVESNTKDIVQEVFLHLWLGRGKLLEIEDPGLWIYRITYNCSYQYIRKQLLQEKTLANMGMEQSTDTISETENHLNLRETQRMLLEAIQQLPSQSKKIYELNRMSGMKPQMIAEELNINVQSVRNSLTRSATCIKEYLVQHGIVIPSIFLLENFFIPR